MPIRKRHGRRWGILLHASPRKGDVSLSPGQVHHHPPPLSRRPGRADGVQGHEGRVGLHPSRKHGEGCAADKGSFRGFYLEQSKQSTKKAQQSIIYIIYLSYTRIYNTYTYTYIYTYQIHLSFYDLNSIIIRGQKWRLCRM